MPEQLSESEENDVGIEGQLRSGWKRMHVSTVVSAKRPAENAISFRGQQAGDRYRNVTTVADVQNHRRGGCLGCKQKPSVSFGGTFWKSHISKGTGIPSADHL